jgi:hypothetical protein
MPHIWLSARVGSPFLADARVSAPFRPMKVSFWHT